MGGDSKQKKSHGPMSSLHVLMTGGPTGRKAGGGAESMLLSDRIAHNCAVSKASHFSEMASPRPMLTSAKKRFRQASKRCDTLSAISSRPLYAGTALAYVPPPPRSAHEDLLAEAVRTVSASGLKLTSPVGNPNSPQAMMFHHDEFTHFIERNTPPSSAREVASFLHMLAAALRSDAVSSAARTGSTSSVLLLLLLLRTRTLQ